MRNEAKVAHFFKAIIVCKSIKTNNLVGYHVIASDCDYLLYSYNYKHFTKGP